MGYITPSNFCKYGTCQETRFQEQFSKIILFSTSDNQMIFVFNNIPITVDTFSIFIYPHQIKRTVESSIFVPCTVI